MNFKILGFYLIFTLTCLPSTIYSTKELQHTENSNASVTKSKSDSTQNNSAHGYTHKSLNAHTLEAVGNHRGIQTPGQRIMRGRTKLDETADLATPHNLSRRHTNPCSDEGSEGNGATPLQEDSRNDLPCQATSANNGQDFMRVVPEKNLSQVEFETSHMNVNLTTAIDPIHRNAQSVFANEAQARLINAESIRHCRRAVAAAHLGATMNDQRSRARAETGANINANENDPHPGPPYGNASYEVLGESSKVEAQHPVTREQEVTRSTSRVIRLSQRSGSTPLFLVLERLGTIGLTLRNISWPNTPPSLMNTSTPPTIRSHQTLNREMLGSAAMELDDIRRRSWSTSLMNDTTYTVPSIRYQHAPAQDWGSCGFCGATAPVYIYCIDGRWHTMCLSCERIIGVYRTTSRARPD